MQLESINVEQAETSFWLIISICYPLVFQNDPQAEMYAEDWVGEENIGERPMGTILIWLYQNQIL